ncbi:MAG TPA: hypothetical protein VGH80_13115 [Xanthomonadaceae bacterium]|jgi:hypothetical protein
MITTDNRRRIAPGDGSTTVFAGPPAYSADVLDVYFADNDSGELTLQLATGYTVTHLGELSTTVTFTSAPPATVQVLSVNPVPLDTTVDGSLVDVTRLMSLFPAISARSKTRDRFSFMEVLDSDADRDEVANYAMTNDLTDKLQEAIYYAAQFGYRLDLPAGLIPLTTWRIDESDTSLLSLNHIHIQGAGSCDARVSSNYKGTVLVQIADTVAPALEVYGDWSASRPLRGVRIRGLSIVGAAENTDWLFDTRNITDFGSLIEDVSLYVPNLAGKGFRGISNWAIRYCDMRLDGGSLRHTGGAHATGTGFSIYGDDNELVDLPNYGVTNMTILSNVEISRFGRGMQLAHFDEEHDGGTTRNVIVMGGQVDSSDLNGIVIGFLQNSQFLSVHVEQSLSEGWLFGKSSGLGAPRQIDLIGCTSFANGADGSSYDMSIVQGTDIEIRNHNFDNTDRGIVLVDGVDNIAIRKPRFNPATSPAGDTAINNPTVTVHTRILVEDVMFVTPDPNASPPLTSPYYTTAYANPSALLFPKRRGGYTGNADLSTTIVLEPGMSDVRLNYSLTTTIDTVTNSDGTQPENGQRFTLTAVNSKIIVASGTGSTTTVPFSVPEGSLGLEPNVVYDFLCVNGAFVPVKETRSTAITSQLNSATQPVNVTGKYAGRMIFNTTTGMPVWATGGSTTSTWVNSAGSVQNTPT